MEQLEQLMEPLIILNTDINQLILWVFGVGLSIGLVVFFTSWSVSSALKIFKNV